MYMDYEKDTAGIRVSVQPRFSLAQSEPEEGRFVFLYHIRMDNEGRDPARLLYRYWRIHDSSGEESEVDGEGVVGEQPLLEAGGSHEYSSFCILRTPVGFMEGFYTFERADGTRFRVEVPRFDLEAPFPPAREQEVN